MCSGTFGNLETLQEVSLIYLYHYISLLIISFFIFHLQVAETRQDVSLLLAKARRAGAGSDSARRNGTARPHVYMIVTVVDMIATVVDAFKASWVSHQLLL
jgi:hypothetical protein